MDNVRYFFEPSSVAVVGASTNPQRGGYIIVDNLVRTFQGPIYPVNPKADTICGLKCYPSVADIPGAVDLAVVLVPAKTVPGVIRQCSAKGVKAVIIEAGGFADAGPEGKALQDEIVAIAAETGMRLWGPNCGGHICSSPPLSTTFIMKTEPLAKGPVSFVSQSGMMAGGLYVQMISVGQPRINKTCTIGNRCDVNESDLLEYLAGDPTTEVIGLYLESIINGRRFAGALRAASARKPAVILKGGRTDLAAQAAMSHTGTLAGNDRIADALMRQLGAYRVNDFVELLDLTKAFSLLPKGLQGKRIGVLTFTGGGAVTASDLLGTYGFELARIGEQTKAKLRQIFPPWLEPGNPVDVWSTIEQQGLDRTMQVSIDALLGDEGVDGVLVLPIAFDYFADFDFKTFTEIIKRHGKPVLTWLIGEADHMPVWTRKLEDGGVPVYPGLETCVKALRAEYDYQRWLNRSVEPLGAGPVAPAVLRETQALLTQAANSGRRVLTEHQSKELLSRWGIPVTREAVARSEEEAVEAAGRIGYPVAIKVSAAEITHKTDIGGVKLGLAGEAEVREAYRQVMRAARSADPQAAVEGVLVQEMVGDGTEVIIGVTNDAEFGPTIMFGLGGVLVEVLKDVSLRVLPISRGDAEEMVKEIKGYRVLEGVRGKPRGDLGALVEVLQQVAAMAGALEDQIAELDINPLIVRPGGQGVVAVDALVGLKERKG